MQRASLSEMSRYVFLISSFLDSSLKILLLTNKQVKLLSDMGFPGGTSGKEHTCQYRRQKRPRFYSWVRKIPWRRAWQPTPVLLPEEFHGQNLEGYSPWGYKEWDTTE